MWAWTFGIALPVGFALLAEIFAIDLATSPDSGVSAALKVSTVVVVVTGVTALAGVALIQPWITKLDTPHKDRVRLGVLCAATALTVGAGFLLTRSIIESDNRAADQEVACVEAEANRRRRESRLDLFAAQDAADARKAEVLQLTDERVRLRQEKGLSRSERRALEASLRLRLQHAQRREKDAAKSYGQLLIGGDPLISFLGDVTRGGGSREDIINRFVRALGC